MSTPLSACIITYNEAALIGSLLDGLSWVDDIVVVDSLSQDNTQTIAKEKGARVFERVFDNFSAQKNHAIKQAKHEWIILIDADELITDELREEILNTINTPSHDGYWIKRKVRWLGAALRFGGLQNEKVLRLIRGNKGHYEREVHEEMIVDGSVGMLENTMMHDTTPTMESYINKHRRYLKLDVKMRLKAGKKTNLAKIYLWPTIFFLRRYIFQGGFLDGKMGLTFHLANAHFVYAKNKLLYRCLRKRN